MDLLESERNAIVALRSNLASFSHELDLESLRVHSLRKNYSLEILTKFYNEHMIPHFPLEDERDELDDWIYCLDPLLLSADRDNQAKMGPLMDILLVLCDTHSTVEDHGRGMDRTVILAGVAFEYYQQAQVGLISYVTTKCSFRNRGIMKTLHPLAIGELEELHRLSHLERFGCEPDSKINAILAETNTVDAGDASQEDIQQRHCSLFALGYRFVEFPYIQPPLGTNMRPFDDVMLLVYQGTDDSRLWFPEWELTSSILYQFVSDFTMSVFGYEQDDSSTRLSTDLEFWSFQKWFAQKFLNVAIRRELPWKIVTPVYKAMYHDHNQLWAEPAEEINHNVVVVIGAGVAGLVASIEMAKNATTPLLIQLIEASDCIGGRVRTILNADDGPRQYVNEDLAKRYSSFYPWAVPLGAEFVHGINSTVNHLIQKNDWEVEETFDFTDPDDACGTEANSFYARSSTKSLTNEQRKTPLVRVFLNGECHSILDGDAQDNSSFLIAEAEDIWTELCNVGERVIDNCKNSPLPDDMRLSEFIKIKMKGRSPEDIATVKSIVDAIYAKTAGTSITCFGVNEGSREELNWDYSDCNFRTKHCFAELVEYLRCEIDSINKKYTKGDCKGMIKVIMKSPIVRVDSVKDVTAYGTKQVVVSARGGTEYIAHKAIVTVPLSILKSRMIEFSGDYRLPEDKIAAIEKINMHSGMKAHVLLRRNVDIRSSLLVDSTDLYFCPDQIFSQIWIQRNDSTIFITGFVVSDGRELLLQLTKSEEMDAQRLFLAQLQRMFHDDDGRSLFIEIEPTCAAFDLYDWSGDEFIGGIYSSPSFGAGWKNSNNKATCRDDLKASICNTIFFAGEHTNTKVCATVQSALDSGIIAARDVLNSFSSDA